MFSVLFCQSDISCTLRMFFSVTLHLVKNITWEQINGELLIIATYNKSKLGTVHRLM